MEGRERRNPSIGREVTVRRPGEGLERPGGVEIGRLSPVLAPRPITVLRTTDLLLARFSFVNLAHDTDQQGRRVLRRRVGNRAAYLVADFQPQHVIEQAFYETAGGSPANDSPTNPGGANPPPASPSPATSEFLPTGPVQARISTHSRLVFQVTTQEILLTLDGLLTACSTLPLSVAPHASSPGSRFTAFADLIASERLDVAAALGAQTLAERVAGTRLVARGLGASRALLGRVGAGESQAVVASLSIAGQLRVTESLLGPGRRTFRVRPVPRPPSEVETSIELPWRLKLSPGPDGGFTHAVDPVTQDGRTELWHTRLGVRRVTAGDKVVIDEHSAADRTVRAIWARDFDQFAFKPQPDSPADFPNADGSVDNPVFRKSLNSRDRMLLVHESSNFTLRRQNRAWDPHTVDVERLMLTTLGGWLRSDFSSPDLPDGPFSLSEWKHRATMGRDHEVKVVYAGFLFPFGHRASLVKVTERKFTPSQPGNPAFLYQRFFLVIRERTRTYTSTATLPDNRDYGPTKGAKKLNLVMPLSSVSILTRVTPNLDPAANLMTAGGMVFFPHVNQAPYLFKILATDRGGNVLEYSAPLMFVERDHNVFDAAQGLDPVIRRYWEASASLRRQPLGGQRVLFAPDVSPAGKALDTELSTQNLFFDALPLGPSTPQDDPRFTPILRSAEVVVPSMSALAGANAPIQVGYPVAYAATGYAQNAASIFLEVAGTPKLDFAAQGDRSGGFVTPNLAITALSGATGPVGGSIDKAMDGSLTPADLFSGITAKLFGIVPLPALLEAVGLGPDDFPAFVGQTLDRVLAFLKDLERVVALAGEVDSRFAAEADAQVQAARTALNGVVSAAEAIISSISAFDASIDLSAQVSTLAGNLAGLAAAVDAAKQLPAGVRTEGVGLARRLGEHVEDVGEIVGLIQQFAQGVTLPPVVSARLSWSTEFHPWPASNSVFQPKPKSGQSPAQARAVLDLGVEVQAPTKGNKPPTALVSCSISAFALQLIGDDPFVALHIEKIEFLLAPGKKPDVNVVFAEPDGVVFGGPLSFVNTLREIIPFDGFSDPPYLDVSPQGIKAGFDLGIPNLTVGVLSLCNISLGAQIRVPFIDDSLDFTFNFCTRENPFRLTVWLFGGGGFFAITIDPEKCVVLEAAFEFGAAVALDFGVASGSIEVMAGIYFRLETGNSVLTGYFRMRGEVDVLGLISASIELYLELTYEFASGKAVGRATLTIEVEIFFLSFSVSISCEKKFKGSNQDPTFAQVMGPAALGAPRPWDEYCAAFAD